MTVGDGADILDSFDLELFDGCCALVGVNGAGKSTLLTILSGSMRPSRGSVTLFGDDLYSRTGRKRALPRVALMPQHLSLPGNLTAHEVIRYIAWMRGVSRAESAVAAGVALDRVGLADRSRSKVRELSGGMIRRLALAQALVSSPDVLLLDEPSTGLDPQQRRRMVEIISELDGVVLFSSHVMEDVEEIASRVVVLDGGRQRFDGTLDELRNRAPAATAPGRRAESGFLHVITSSRTD